MPNPSSTARRARRPARPSFEIADAEEARIQARIAADPDNPELTDEQIAQLRPASEVLPFALYAKLIKRGRPKAGVTKVPVKLRLDPDVVAAFKSTGPGWQTRINDLLKTAVTSLTPMEGAAGLPNAAAETAVGTVDRAKTRKAKIDYPTATTRSG